MWSRKASMDDEASLNSSHQDKASLYERSLTKTHIAEGSTSFLDYPYRPSSERSRQQSSRRVPSDYVPPRPPFPPASTTSQQEDYCIRPPISASSLVVTIAPPASYGSHPHSEAGVPDIDWERAFEHSRRIEHIDGWRLYALTAALCISLLLTEMESTIVSLSIIVTSNALEASDLRSWIMTAYLLGFGSILVLTTRLSDIYGRKIVLLTAISIFTIATVGCGAANTMTELIFFRAIQGIGGGAMHATSWTIFPEMVPKGRYLLFSSILASIFFVASFLGPTIGGSISTTGHWRWIYVWNVPFGVMAFLLTLIAMPSNFPYFSLDTRDAYSRSLWSGAREIDLFGGVLLAAVATLIIAAVEACGTTFSWTDQLPSSLINNGLWFLVALLLWLKFVDWSNSTRESLLPWRILSDRGTLCTLLLSFFSGGIFFGEIVVLTQMNEVAHGLSPLDCGTKLLVTTTMIPLGAAVGAQLIQRLHLRPLDIGLVGGALMVLGTGLMISLPITDPEVHAGVFGFGVILGLGFGFIYGSVYRLGTVAFEAQDRSIAISLIAQFRSFGGALALAVCANIGKNDLYKVGLPVLSPAQLALIRANLDNMATLSSDLQSTIGGSFALQFRDQMYFLLGLGFLSLFAGIAMVRVETKPIGSERWPGKNPLSRKLSLSTAIR